MRVFLCACLLLCGPAAGQAPTAAALSAFLEWFKEEGGVADSLSLSAFPAMGTGVKAVQDIQEDDTIISVPLSLVICRETVTSVGSDAEQALFGKIENDEDLVAAFLVKERALGAASRWAPYVAALPASVPLAFTFSEDELDELQSAVEASHARRQRQKLNAQYKAVSGRLVEALELAGLSDAQVAEVPTEEWFTWATSLVHSRALTIQGRKYLVPLADMFNYQPQDTEREAASGAHFLKYHVLSSTHFTVKADRPAAAGSQVFEDYGDNDNTLYLHHHGFVAMDNPFDCINVELPDLLPSDALLQTKRRLLRSLRLSRNLNFCMAPGAQVPRRVFDWLHVVYMKAAALKQCDAVLGGSKSRKDVLDCLGHTPDLSVGNSRLLKVLTRQSKAFPTSAKTDVAILAEEDVSDNTALAIRYRLTRKRLLKTLIKGLKSPPKPTPTPTPPAEAPPKDIAGIVDRFNTWFADQEPPVALIKAAVAGGGMRLGVVATRDIAPEEPYVSVPVGAIMSTDSAFRCPHVGPVLRKLRQRYPSGDPFHELLFHLVYEAFVLRESSFFKPYLDYLPTAEEMLFPSFYSEVELAELQASTVATIAAQYQQEVEQKFSRLEGILGEYGDVLTPDVFTFDNYKWAHAILDSRSIWWNGERHLVPLLDLINCMEGPDPSRVHSTKLDTSGDNAVTLSPWAFKEGEPVYENYGQPNHVYFTYHGFSLESNTHDCVRIPLTVDPALSDTQRDARVAGLKLGGFRSDTALPCVDPSPAKLRLDPRDSKFLQIAYDTDAAGSIATLKRIAKAQLRAYATTAEEDVELLEGGGLSPRLEASIRFRLSEKRLLHEIAHHGGDAPATPRRRARGEL